MVTVTLSFSCVAHVWWCGDRCCARHVWRGILYEALDRDSLFGWLRVVGKNESIFRCDGGGLDL